MSPRSASLAPVAAPPSPLAGIEALATPLRRRRGEIVCDGERSAPFLYRVEAGAARRCALSADGRRRIVDLLFPGDFFGFDGEGRAGSSIEALTEGTIVLRYPRREVEALADADPQAARAIREIAFAAIARLETQISLLGRVNAVEKVGAFLLALEERQSAGERAGPRRVTLPVSRCDIGDFLALAPETVSRSFAALERRGAISLSAPRDVAILDRAALRARGQR
ncbi:helix-turn-helix domain-containing protein [Methylosinus sp. Sm6]|uniref:helix-turn-helix domain-containing protein n=1 Tax=Methylosinus sp. Sm6 TaxID=2866948 RepID=UPI001C991D1E|nr:helix-turn-helix domain-containing protein [Methylosinus sp. Sm6]MBY6241056.1 helix-turn-helix domain-containing protein [Methylosinus sp. Sm6]